VGRANNFDLLRLIAAVSVIFSHAFLIGEGRQDIEPLAALTGNQSVLGVVGVFVFFAISGFLVTQSWETTGSPLRFFAKRALRIYPGLLACLLVCAFIVGPLVGELRLAEYLGHWQVYDFVGRNLLMDADHNRLPGVQFSGFPVGGIVDGPLWSLPCEVLMYLLVGALGALRLLTLPTVALLLGVGLVCIVFDTSAFESVFGGAGWLLGFFAAGMGLYKLRGTRILDGRLALLAVVGLVLSVPLGRFVLLFPLFGGYLVIFLALWPRLPRIRAARFGDLSYGLYIYGWPVEQLAVRWLGGAAPWWQVFAIGLAGSLVLAFLSWHLVERPALRLRPRAAAEPSAAPALQAAG
jgi:peptidoglycan/LPS O-acetylase OafA/YrhL